FDIASSVLPEWLAHGIRPREVLRFLAWVYVVDTALAPVAIAVAFAATADSLAVLLVLPLIALLGFFARDRRIRIDQEVDLTTAYRGTALLLGDVIEGDD